MTCEVAQADTSILIKQATTILRKHDVAILVVCRDNEPVFALTEYDVANLALACGDHHGTTPVYDLIGKRTAIRCRENAILADAIGTMVDHRVRHIPVVDAENNLVGALSLVNAVGALTPAAAAAWLAKMQPWSDKESKST